MACALVRRTILGGSALCVVIAAACSINPQPLPPDSFTTSKNGDQDGGGTLTDRDAAVNGAGSSGSSSGTSGAPGVDAGAVDGGPLPPPNDSGNDLTDASTDAPEEPSDGRATEDAETDGASDALDRE